MGAERMVDELRQARRAVAKGRTDEALVHLWNALEPARLAGDASALENVARLAAEIGRRGGPGEQREAERLLNAVRRSAGAAPAEVPAAIEREAEALEPAGEIGEGEVDVVPDEDVETELGEPVRPREGGGRTEQPRRQSLARLLLPLIFVVIILVNVLNRLLSDR